MLTCLTWTILQILFFKLKNCLFYVKGRETKIFCLLVYSPKAFNSWMGLALGAEGGSWEFNAGLAHGVRDSATWTIICCLLGDSWLVALLH